MVRAVAGAILVCVLLSLVPILSTVRPAAASLADYSISASTPSSDHVKPGGSANSTITVTSDGVFLGEVSLSADSPGSSSDFTFSFDPQTVSVSPIANGKSTLTITASSSISPGSYTIAVTGTCSAMVCPSSPKSASVGISVDQVQTGDFRISASPLTLNIPTGSSQSSTVTVTSTGGLAGTVQLSTSTSSPNISASCNPMDVVLPAGGTGRSTCSTTPSATGSYSVTITGSFQSLSHSAAITVISYKDQNLADFTLSANPQSLIAEAGHSNSTALTITSKSNFAGQVDLSSPNPDAVFSNSTVNVSAGGNANSILTIGARSSEQVTVTATYQQSITHTVTVSVSVVDFRLAGPASMNCQSGLRCSANLAVTSFDSFSGYIALSMIYPKGLTASLAPDSFSLSANQQVSVGLDLNSTLARDFTVVVTATSGQLSHSINVSVRFTDFSIETSPASVTLLSGSLASSVITLISLNRFWDSVRLSATASVPAISCSFTVTPVALQPDQTANSTLTIEAADTVSGGDYTITISGTSNGGLLHQATVALTIVTDFAVSIDSPAVTLPVGGSAASKLTIAGSQGFSGSVTLSATSTTNGVELAFDQQVVWLSHGQHAALATLKISTYSSAVAGTYSILIIGTSGSQTRNASITLVLTPSPQISVPSSLKTIAGSLVVFMVTATDSDSSKTITLIAIPSTMPPGATFTSATGSGPVRGVFNWIPKQARDLGEHNITFSVTDGHGGKSSASIIVIVNPVSHPSFPIGAAGWVAIAFAGAGLALLGDLVWKRKIRMSVLLPDD